MSTKKTGQMGEAMAEKYLKEKWQVDVIGIKLDIISKKAKIRHFKNAVFLLK